MQAIGIALASALTASATTFGIAHTMTTAEPTELPSVVAASSARIQACAHQRNGRLRLLTSGTCKKDERRVVWSRVGPRGPAGPPGPPGPSGSSDSDLPPWFSDDDDVAPPIQTPSPFGSNTGRAVAGYGAECTLGTIMLTAGTVGPGIPARGQLLRITEHIALYSLMGTTFGGDGSTTFALPDLRAAAPNGTTYMICDTNMEAVYPPLR